MSRECDATYSVYDETKRRARKEHTCMACGETIAVGHYYFHVVGICDGGVDTIKRCIRCQTIHLHLRGLSRYDMVWPDERLNCGEEYENHWGRKPPPKIAALAFMTQDEMQEVAP